MSWADVTRALLGSWPGTVAAWGADAIGAYVEEVRARGVTAEQALAAIRSWPAGSDFPPSAPNLAAAARRDASVPTFDELFTLIYGRGGILKARGPYTGPVRDPQKARDAAAMNRAAQMHPLISAFVGRYGLQRLRLLEVDDPDIGGIKRRELAESWSRFLEASEGREVAALVARRGRGELRGIDLDPLAALGERSRARVELEAGS